MRPSLIMLGLLVLVVGASMYSLPQDTRANARDTQAPSNIATIGIAVMLIGALIGLLGIVIPGARFARRDPRNIQNTEHIASIRNNDGQPIEEVRYNERRL